MRHQKTYQCWQDMRQRCTNPRHRQFSDYGGRGIVVCADWLASYDSFLLSMGEKPDGLTLDRIDVNGNYEPSNCRWATASQQNANRRDCVHLEHNGKRMTVEEWGRHIGRHPTTIRSRIKAGWLLDDVLDPHKQPRGGNSAPRQLAAMKAAHD